jgi:3-oxoacyl-[acyl-carrier protein] reductase
VNTALLEIHGGIMGVLDGRIALVTGGGRGIGRAISELLASEGATVAINYRRDKEAAEETQRAILDAGGLQLFIKDQMTFLQRTLHW